MKDAVLRIPLSTSSRIGRHYSVVHIPVILAKKTGEKKKTAVRYVCEHTYLAITSLYSVML